MYVDKNGEIIGTKSEHLTGGATICDVDFGVGASMSRFSFNSGTEKGCSKNDIYKSGDDNFVFCAASSVKAALAVVLAALLAILF